ncbi:hypothetical protein D3C72_1026260 [compost metagenome]
MRVLAIARHTVHVTHAGTERQAVKRTGFDVVAQPGAGHIARGVDGAFALLFRAALLITNVRVGIGRLHAQAVGELADSFQLHAFRFDLPDGAVRICRLLFGGDVFLVNAEHRRTELAVHPLRLHLHARFPLLALHRVQDLAVLIGKAGRREGRGVADVRCNTVIEQVQQRRTAAEVVLIQIAAAAVELVDIGDAHLVVTPAQRQSPAVDGHLILQVVARLAQLVLLFAVHGDVIRLRAVHRVEGIDRRETTVVASGIVAAILIIQTDQHAVVHRPGIEAAVHLVIQRDRVHLLVGTGVAAIQIRFVQPSCGIDLIQLDFGMQVAQLLAHRPAAIKHMFDVVADHVLAAVIFVVIVFAFKEGIGNLLAVVGNHGAFVRQARVAPAFRIAMQIGHQIETRVVGDTPGEARHQRVALFLQRAKLRIGVAGHPAQTCGHAVVIVQRTGDVEHRPALIVIPGEKFDLTARIK